MKIESLRIKNYRSIRAFEIGNLTPINVFFGKNNVGKSNILRGLHLGFCCLKNNRIYLSDTAFHKRNIYKPIEIKVDLTLDEDFYNAEQVSEALDEAIQGVSSTILHEQLAGDLAKQMEEFIEQSTSFKPVRKLCLETQVNYNEETSDVGLSIADLESDHVFDYGTYRSLYHKLRRVIEQRIGRSRETTLRAMFSDLTRFGIDISESMAPTRYLYDLQRGELSEMDLERIRRDIARRIAPSRRDEAQGLLEHYMEELREPPGVTIEPFSRTFNIVKEYFDRISDNFILIPNKEYFSKGPLDSLHGSQIEIFDIHRFEDRLVSLIESPSKTDRKLIGQFNRLFTKSYADLGEMEIRKFRDKVFAILDTGFTALPIENQGLGIQDLFLYLAHIILFNWAIIAIEEPEGGLSTENQRTLHNVIEEVYLASDKQIFISSHSEEFETPNSYLIEMDEEGTKEISRIENQGEYETKIDKVLVNRKLAEEKAQYEALLKETTERQMTLDILNHISKLGDDAQIDAQKISDELGYTKEKVQEILGKLLKQKRKTK